MVWKFDWYIIFEFDGMFYCFGVIKIIVIFVKGFVMFL